MANLAERALKNGDITQFVSYLFVETPDRVIIRADHQVQFWGAAPGQPNLRFAHHFLA